MSYKHILIILLILVAAEVGWLVWRVPKLKRLQSQAEVQEGIVKEEKETGEESHFAKASWGEAKLWFEPSEGEFSGQFTVDILLETEKPIDGLDVRLFYPKDKLSIIDQDANIEGTQVGTGEFDEYPLNKVDDEQELILLSGIVLGKSEEVIPLNQPFFVGRVTFNTLASGEARVGFDFQPGSTTDCNVASSETHKDILKEALGARFILK